MTMKPAAYTADAFASSNSAIRTGSFLEVVGNTATSRGGGLHNAEREPGAEAPVKAFVNSSSFELNEANLGRAFWNGSELEVRASAVKANSATESGGGIYNTALLERLKTLLPSRKIEDTGALGIGPKWVEAAAFAWLAKRTIEGKPANAAGVTGASGWGCTVPCLAHSP